jgi:hypothetical protein
MNFFTYLKTLERVHSLIRRKATGTPTELAARLGMPERNLYRLLSDMKNWGFPIQYCQDRQSYYYSCHVRFNLDLDIDNDKKPPLDDEAMGEIEGGKYFNYFQKKFSTASFWQCADASLHQVNQPLRKDDASGQIF